MQQQSGAGPGAPPVLALFKGHPGVGKSTLARRVCRLMAWPLIDKDDARDCLQQALADQQQQQGPQHHASQQQQQQHHQHQQQQQQQHPPPLDANALSYDIMFAYCATQLSLGLSAALDSPFARPALYDRAVRVAREYGATVAVVECVASNEQAWRQQLEARGRLQRAQPQSHKPQTWEDVQQLIGRYGGSHEWTRDGSRALQHHCVVDMTTTGLEEAAAEVQAFLSRVRADAAGGQQQHAVVAPV